MIQIPNNVYNINYRIKFFHRPPVLSGKRVRGKTVCMLARKGADGKVEEVETATVNCDTRDQFAKYKGRRRSLAKLLLLWMGEDPSEQDKIFKSQVWEAYEKQCAR